MKKSQVKIIAVLGACILTLSQGACNVFAGTADETQTEMTTEADDTEKLEEGQRKATIHVVSITGNELTYYEETTESTSEEESSGDESKEDAAETTKKTIGGDSAETTEASSIQTTAESSSAQTTSAPGSDSTSGGGLSGSFAPSQMGNGNFDPGQMQNSNFDPSQMQNGNFDPSQTQNNDFDPSQLSGSGVTQPANVETTTVYLPVAVPVHVSDTETRTFTILEAGDTLTVLFEENKDGEEIITEIWLEETEGDTQ